MKEYINNRFNIKRRPLAEWEKQCAIQLTWPHKNSDWDYCLDDVIHNFVELAHTIIRFENLIIVTDDEQLTRTQLGADTDFSRIKFFTIPSNDTWARDHNVLSVNDNGRKKVINFVFNGWGMKFASNKDNQIAPNLNAQNCFAEDVEFVSSRIALEGGAVDFDEYGNMLSTTECLCSKNRNEFLSWNELNDEISQDLLYAKCMALEHGALEGDDTDSHVDTLARFCNNETIAYVKCYDEKDSHYADLQAMEKELKSLKNYKGEPYKLIELPLPDAVYEDGERLPATYANFLIINGAVLVPTYNQEKDKVALERLQKIFPNREVIGIDCQTLIRQHGSLHCVTMQYPESYLR